jgi:hypothetical protein
VTSLYPLAGGVRDSSAIGEGCCFFFDVAAIWDWESRSERRGFLEGSLSSAPPPYIPDASLEVYLQSMGGLGILDRASIATSLVAEPCLPASQGSYESQEELKKTMATLQQEEESKEREQQHL